MSYWIVVHMADMHIRTEMFKNRERAFDSFREKANIFDLQVYDLDESFSGYAESEDGNEILEVYSFEFVDD